MLILCDVCKLSDPHGPGMTLRVMLLNLPQVFLKDAEPHLLLRQAGVRLVGLHLETVELGPAIRISNFRLY